MLHQINWLDDKFNGIIVSAGWIKDLESSDSRKFKEQVIEKALMASKLGSVDAQAFLFNCYQAYNPFFTFNIKQIPEVSGQAHRENPWTKFWALLEALRTRSLTGNAARGALEKLSEEFDDDEWNVVCRRVISKDLRCGISEKTLNNVLGNTGWAIPTFSCQLAQDSTDHKKKLQGNKRLECKLDGVRVLAVVQGMNVSLFSRNGKEFLNFEQVADDINQYKKFFQQSLGTKNFVLDGEIVGKNFQSLMKQAHRKTDVNTTGMIYHIFDILPLTDFQRGFWNTKQKNRTEILEKFRDKIEQSTILKIMPGLDVDLSTASGNDIMTQFAKSAIDNGFEGIMIKSVDAPYECRRSDFWMKWKPNIEVTLEIINVEEGTGKNKGRLGAFVCSGTDDGRDIRVNVGSGFTDDQRSEFWASRNDLPGSLVEVRADAVTQNQDGTYSLRFPRFKTFRGFDPGEKI